MTFKATPESGYKFTNWTAAGDTEVSASEEYTTRVFEDLTLTANFEQRAALEYQLKADTDYVFWMYLYSLTSNFTISNITFTPTAE